MIVLLSLGMILHLLLINAFKDPTLVFKILYHYSSLDIRFLISFLFQLYWLIVLSQCVFRYLEIDTYIHIRLSLKQRLHFYFKKTFIFSIIYILFQTMIMIFYHYYPFHLILYALICYYISMTITLIMTKKNDNILMIMALCLIVFKLI